MSAALKATLAESAAANALARHEAERQAEFLATAARCTQERKDLESAASEREAEALVAGEPVPEVPLAESRKVGKLDREARAAEAAARKLGELIAGPIAHRENAARIAVTDAALTTSRDLRDGALAASGEHLEALVPHLAEMIAAQRLRDHLAGVTFDFDGARHPPSELFDGATVARKFVADMPARLRPAGFGDRVEAAAKERLAALLAELEVGS